MPPGADGELTGLFACVALSTGIIEILTSAAGTSPARGLRRSGYWHFTRRPRGACTVNAGPGSLKARLRVAHAIAALIAADTKAHARCCEVFQDVTGELGRMPRARTGRHLTIVVIEQSLLDTHDEGRILLGSNTRSWQ